MTEPLALRRLPWWKRAILAALYFMGWPEKANELEARWLPHFTFQVTNVDLQGKFTATICGAKEGTSYAEEKESKEAGN